MKMTGNTILITGGGSGIGLALVERFLKAGNQVIICGRNAQKLDEAKAANPGLKTYVCDVAIPAERVALFEKITADFPKLNVVLNNAGIMRFIKIDQQKDWQDTSKEITTNLEAPIHFATLFANHLAQQDNATFLTVTSGLAHVPLVASPVYCATKAAMHSFTLTLRAQWKASKVEVIEICPPHVNTDLGAPGANTAGIPLDTFADVVFQGLEDGDEEITYGFSAQSSQANKVEREKLFDNLNATAAH
jgi:uncharacterized oxidoreductase